MLARAVPFDLALVDVDLGLAACERIAAAGRDLRVALLTSRWDLVPMRTARAAGARGVIEQELPARELLTAVHTLASRRRYEPAPGGTRRAPLHRA